MSVSKVHHFIPNNTVNKYELMNIFNDIFQKNLQINRINKPDQKVDRTLGTNYEELAKLYNQTDMKTAILNLKKYMENSIYK